MKERVLKRFSDEIATLERELKVELPKEIQRAREYGDLRENAEYKAAKERQELLNARIAMLKKRMREISPDYLNRFVAYADALVWLDQATGGRLHQNGWASIDLADGATLFLERRGAAWQPRAARRPGWQIEYRAWQGAFPQTVALRSLNPSLDVDLTAAIAQLETNVPLDAAAFAVNVPAAALDLSLEELRDAGPLRAQ